MDYVNTRETIGERATLDGLVSGTLDSLTETRVQFIGPYGLNSAGLKSVYLPNVTTLDSYSMCVNVFRHISVEMFPVLKKIMNNAFASCNRVEDAVFSESIISIDKAGFYSCGRLSHVVLNSATRVSLSTFSDTVFGTPIRDKVGAIYVPENLVSSYTSYYGSYANFLPISEYKTYEFGTITDSLDEILESEENGTYLEKYSIGDTKTFPLSIHFTNDLDEDGLDYYFTRIAKFRIVAFDQDDLADDSGKAHITWLLETPFIYSVFDTNNAGWEDCFIRKDTIPMILNANPALNNAIKPVKKTYYDYESRSTKMVIDKISIPSAKEVGSALSPIENDGIVYDALTTNNSRRFLDNARNINRQWFLRSSSSSTTDQIYVTSSGTVSTISKKDNSFPHRYIFCT